jgi:hypothetical protein
MRIGFRGVPTYFHGQLAKLVRDNWKAGDQRKNIQLGEPPPHGVPAKPEPGEGDAIALLTITLQGKLAVVEPADAVSLALMLTWERQLEAEGPTGAKLHSVVPSAEYLLARRSKRRQLTTPRS